VSSGLLGFVFAADHKFREANKQNMVGSAKLIDLYKKSNPYVIAGVLVLCEVALLACIIQFRGYTEIDWIAYMQEVEGWLKGELNYYNLKGDTGPLVYPAVFLYIFGALHQVTNGGTNIRLAQWIFAGIYIINLIVVFAIYISCGEELVVNVQNKLISNNDSVDQTTTHSAKRHAHSSMETQKGENTTTLRLSKSSDQTLLPMWIWPVLVLSLRIHSIFVLRMFNDTIAILFGYISIYLFINNKYRFGCLIYSLGVGVKMNMLLYAPGVLLCMLLSQGIVETFTCLSICALTQLITGYAFLSTYPIEYLSRSFELNRVFFYKWTVNFKFLDENIFLSKKLSILLLLFTIFTLSFFAKKWIKEQNIGQYKKNLLGFSRLRPSFIVITIFTSNFIGIAFSRTLHYQFYSWYYHTLPMLLWHTRYHYIVCIMICIGIEIGFNVYPATSFSSLLLQSCHIMILYGLYTAPAPQAFIIDEKKEI
jgi:alpha-1,3-mannosyltransferase